MLLHNFDNSNLTEIEKLIWTSAFAQHCNKIFHEKYGNTRLVALEAVQTADKALKCYRAYDINDKRVPH